MSKATVAGAFTPQTPLGKKLWQIRQQAINAGLELLNEEQLEQTLREMRREKFEKSLLS